MFERFTDRARRVGCPRKRVKTAEYERRQVRSDIRQERAGKPLDPIEFMSGKTPSIRTGDVMRLLQPMVVFLVDLTAGSRKQRIREFVALLIGIFLAIGANLYAVLFL